MRLSAHMRSVIDPPVDSINRERIRLEKSGGSILNLGQAIPDFEPPPVAVAAAIRALENPMVHVYTNDQGLLELRRAIADSLALRFGVSGTAAERIVVTAGANHAFLLACSSLIEGGDKVGLLSPYFVNHQMTVVGCGGIIVEIPPDYDFAYPAARIEQAILEHSLRLLVIVNPSNPSGKVFSAAELEALVALCNKHRVWLISDEVYGSFVYEPAAMTSVASFPGAAECAIIISSFSKEFALTGWRVGWILAPPSVVAQLLKIQDYSLICAPRISQIVALAALVDAPDWAQLHLAEFALRKKVLVSTLQQSGAFSRICDGDGAYFVWLRPGADVDSAAAVRQIMEQARVCIMPGSLFGSAWSSWFRISYGNQPADSLRSAADRLSNYFLAFGLPPGF